MLSGLDLVFSANVFAARLSNSEPNEEDNEQFISIRRKLDSIALEVEPFAKNMYFDTRWISGFIDRKDMKAIFLLQRVIDQYLINFKKDGQTLVRRSLESSMWHKRSRCYEVVEEDRGAVENIL